MITGDEGVALPAQAISDGKCGKQLPLVARVEGPLAPPQGVGVRILNRLTNQVRQSQHEGRPTVVEVCGRPAVERGGRRPGAAWTGKAETAASRLKGASLRLEVVNTTAGVLDAEAQRAAALIPAQVSVAYVLVGAEQKGIASAGVSKMRPRVELKRWYATLQPVGPIGPWDVQSIETEVRADIHVFSAKPLAGVDNICVQQHVRSKAVRGPQANVLNPSISIAL